MRADTPWAIVADAGTKRRYEASPATVGFTVVVMLPLALVVVVATSRQAPEGVRRCSVTGVPSAPGVTVPLIVTGVPTATLVALAFAVTA